MTKIKRLTLLTLLTLMFQFTFGQKQLYGTWQVGCPFEESDEKAKTVCTLCPLILRDKGFTIQGLEMKISAEEIVFNFNYERKESVKYKWDDVTKTLELNYKEINYKFKVLYAGYGTTHIYILKNTDGRLLLLAQNKKP